MNIVAHPDDDLIFLSPDLLRDVRSGKCVRTVFVTGGDAGGPLREVKDREQGVQAAYADMLNVDNMWTTSDAGIAGRNVILRTLVAAPEISLAFLRLPDGNVDGQGFAVYSNQSLRKLWGSDIPTMTAVDGSSQYTRAALTSTLTEFMTDFQPGVVRTQDYATDPRGGDHWDHLSAASFVRSAHNNYPTPHTIKAYQGYGTNDRPQNVFGSDLTAKQRAFKEYTGFDSGADNGWFGSMLLRQYVLDSTIVGSKPPNNLAPVADAGADQSATAGSSVRLTGAGSSDPDGDALTYAWTQTAGPSVTLSATDVARPTFTAPAAGSSVTFSLVVRDGSLASPADTVTVSVGAAVGENVARTLSASATASSQSSGQGAAKVVDGSPSGYPADSSKEWASAGQGEGAWVQLAWTKPVELNRVVLYDRPNTNDRITAATLTFSDGSTVTVPALNNDGSATAVKFSARTVSSVRLSVDAVGPNTANVGLAEFEAWGVAASSGSTNRAPVADAGVDQSVSSGSSVQLTGSGSSDPDGDALTYAWTQTAGPSVTLSATDVARPTFTAPAAGSSVTFSLVVRDGSLTSPADTVTISVGSPPANRAPVADAGVDQSVNSGSSVQLTGSGSSDPDGDALTYAWTQTAGPSVTLSATDVARPTFTAPAAGSSVTFSLVVRDGSLTSPADTVTVSVGAAVGENVARTLSASATASSQSAGSGQTAAKAVDGSPLGYPTDSSREWASAGQRAGAWIQLAWASPVELNRVVLYDRPNGNDWITGATLTFSDGSTVPVPSLNNNGSATTVTFPARKASSVRLTVDSVSATTENVGLAEFEAWGVAASSGSTNRAPVADAGADQSVNSGSSVQLTGSGSSDPDGDALTYAWTQTAGPSVTLSATDVARPTFTAPAAGSSVTFSLVVRDGSLTSPADTVTVSVGAAVSENVARTLSASATASSQSAGSGQTAAKAVDGSPLGYPTDSSREWASAGQRAGAWIQLAWASPVALNRVVLYDRPNGNDWITGATLTFSDGSTVPVPSLNNNGSATTVTFPARTVTSVRLTVDSVSATTENVGLAEFEAWSAVG